VILFALIALAVRAAASPARAAASPAEAARAEAIRYADALTGVDPDGDDDEEDDDDDDDDDDDETNGGDATGGDDRRGPEDRRDGDGPGNRAATEDDDNGDDGDDDDRSDGSLAEDDDIRRMIAEDGDVQDERDPAIAGSVTGELAALDAATAPGAAGDDVSFSAASAGAPETYESWMRHQRPSRWGRLDLGVQWRRRWSEPMQAMSRRYDEVWLVATWRR
jgi:hypothetical protein